MIRRSGGCVFRACVTAGVGVDKALFCTFVHGERVYVREWGGGTDDGWRGKKGEEEDGTSKEASARV